MVLAVAASTLMAVGAIFEALVALDVLPIGRLPGDDPPAGDIVGSASGVGVLLGLVVCFSSIRHPRGIALPARILLPTASAALLVAGYYSYDPYCAPARCRVSSSSGFPAGVVFACVAAAAVVAVCAARLPRLGTAFAGVAIATHAIVAFLIGPWH